MKIKFIFDGLAVRKSVSDVSFAAVSAAAIEAHPGAPSGAFLSWVDEDGDNVRIGNEEELTEALEEAGSVPRFHLTGA